MCPEIWQRSAFQRFRHDLPFVSEPLEPVKTSQPVQEVPEALLNVARLFIFIMQLLQQQQCVFVSFRRCYLRPLCHYV